MPDPSGGGRPRPPRRSLDDFTAREVEIVELVASGLTNRQIGTQLHITEKTVEYHLHNLYTQLGIATRTALVHVWDTHCPSTGEST
ncbi:MAG: helix-turn-helix domain-containing protein [Candidatus Dormibacteria bacterium]